MTTSKDNPRSRVMAVFSQVPTRPDWAAWQKITSAPLWELVALSCDVEPSDIRGWEAGLSRYRAPRAFIARLRHAEAMLSTNGGGLQCVPEGERSSTARVELADFRAWMEFDGFAMPEGFPNFPPSHPPREDAATRALRLTQRVEEMRERRKDFMAFVASEEGISVQRLQHIVGTVAERKNRLAAHGQR